MPDLNFQVERAAPERFALAPHLLFKLAITETVKPGQQPMPIHAVALRCQVRIEPARRRYSAAEKDRLRDLFGTPERWGQTLLPLLWTHVSTVVPPFTGSQTVEVPVPCSFDFSLAATKYFTALDEGDMPLRFLFSGTIFYQNAEGFLQVAQVPWEKEAAFPLPSAIWRELTDLYYPNCSWLCLRKDVFAALDEYRSRHNLPTWEQTIQSLLAALEPVQS
jgi:hypothetical protein